MDYPKSYIDYLVYFHGQRDYFECHEVLEEYWKGEGTIQDHYWVGLIQIAVALYHHRRENFSGAERMISSAINNLKQNITHLTTIGLDSSKILELLEVHLTSIKKLMPYESFNLPITDPILLKICQDRCNEINLQFGTPSNMNNEFLLHKHKLRDRTLIIKERASKLINKSKR